MIAGVSLKNRSVFADVSHAVNGIGNGNEISGPSSTKAGVCSITRQAISFTLQACVVVLHHPRSKARSGEFTVVA